jgi:hypothetical protein
MREALAYLTLLLGASLACSYPTWDPHLRALGAGGAGFGAWQPLGGSPGAGGYGGGFNLTLPDAAGGTGGGSDGGADGGDAGDDASGDAGDDGDAAAD